MIEILPKTLRKIILKSNFVSEKDFDEAAKTAKELNKPLTDILLFKGDKAI